MLYNGALQYPGTKPGCFGRTVVDTWVYAEHIPYETHPSNAPTYSCPTCRFFWNAALLRNRDRLVCPPFQPYNDASRDWRANQAFTQSQKKFQEQHYHQVLQQQQQQQQHVVSGGSRVVLCSSFEYKLIFCQFGLIKSCAEKY